MVLLTRTELIDKRYNFFLNNISRGFSMDFLLLSDLSSIYIYITLIFRFEPFNFGKWNGTLFYRYSLFRIVFRMIEW